jgi:hypothetical protein
MATINDVVNSQLARVMGNHGAPLRALAEKEAANEALANRIKFAQMADASETARAMTLLNAREKFSASESEKNRKAQRENTEAQAKAVADRMEDADKRRMVREMIKDGVDVGDGDVDRQLVTGLKKKSTFDYDNAKRAAATYRGFESKMQALQNDITNAESEDRAFVQKLGREIAAPKALEALKMVMEEDDLKAAGGAGMVSRKSIETARLPTKRRAQLLDKLDSLEAKIQSQAEAEIASKLDSRPTFEKLKSLRLEQRKQDEKFSQFKLSSLGGLALERMAYEQSEKPMTLDTQPDDRKPAGIETAKEILGQLNSGATFRPVAGEVRQRDEQLMSEPQVDRQLEQELQARLDRAKSRNQSPEDLRFSEEALARRDAWLAGRMGLKPEQIGASVFNRSPESQAKAMVGSRDPRAMSVIENLPPTERNALYAEMMGRTLFKPVAGNIRMVDEQLMNQAGQIRYGAPSMQEQQALAQMFGSDAPDLMPEVAKLASANGMSQDEQLSTYRAAMSGDPSAVDRMNVILNYVRQSKYSPDFMPVSTPELTAP